MTHAFKGILLMELDTGAQTITPVLPVCDRLDGRPRSATLAIRREDRGVVGT
jgi:hypothetical protein